MTIEADDPRAAFIRAAVVSPLHDHSSGTLHDAGAIPAAHPEIAASRIHAAVLGDDAGFR